MGQRLFARRREERLDSWGKRKQGRDSRPCFVVVSEYSECSEYSDYSDYSEFFLFAPVFLRLADVALVANLSHTLGLGEELFSLLGISLLH